MNYTHYIFAFICLISIYILLFYTPCHKLIGGNTKDKKDKKDTKDTKDKKDKKDNTFQELESMTNHKTKTNEQMLQELEKQKIKYSDDVKAQNNLYNNLLTNLSTSDDELLMTELDLQDVKNNLMLTNINIDIIQNKINLKKTTDKNKTLLQFYLQINKSKQYNIYTIILLNKLKKTKKYGYFSFRYIF